MSQITVFFNYLIVTVAAIFVIVNPLTTAFVFVSLVPRATDEQRKHMARKAVLIATGVLFIFALLGSVIFQAFGITLEAFRIAGGIILFGIAMGMIRQGEDEGEQGEDPDSAPAKRKGQLAQDVSIIPLAIPFISGPGSIATVMVLTIQAPSVWHLGLLFFAIMLATGTCYLMMLYSKYLVRLLGETGKQIVTKLFGLILAVIAVQFIINGVYDVYAKLPEPGSAVVTEQEPHEE